MAGGVFKLLAFVFSRHSWGRRGGSRGRWGEREGGVLYSERWNLKSSWRDGNGKESRGRGRWDRCLCIIFNEQEIMLTG